MDDEKVSRVVHWQLHEPHDVFGRVNDREAHARRSMVTAIRFKHMSRRPELPYEQFDAEYSALVPVSMSLSDQFSTLTSAERAGIRYDAERPSVDMVTTDKEGRERRWFQEPYLHLLDRLERGVSVGPADETQVVRKAGDVAFTPKAPFIKEG